MGDININDTDKQNNQINVSVGGSSSSVNLTADLAQYYANKAKKWAISTEIVDNEDYSAKYYANKAKNETLAVSQISSQVLDISNNAIQNINEQTENSINTIKAIEKEAKDLTEQALTDINNADLNALDNIQDKRNKAIEEIQTESEIQVNNIKSTGFYMEGGKLYYTDEDGEVQEFKSGNGTSLPLFTPVTMDHVLSFEESMGYALQGTYVYKTGIAGERYGYPDFIQRCFDEKAAGIESQVTLGDSEITIFTNNNGHQYYNIADKEVVDEFYNTFGIAWLYGIDEENERVFLPRCQATIGRGIMPTTVPVVGTGKAMGVTFNGKTTSAYTSQYMYSNLNSMNFARTSDLSVAGTTNFITSANRYGLTPVASESGVVANISSLSDNQVQGYLYIVVGNTSELTHVTTTIPDSEVLSQVNKNTSDIIELNERPYIKDFYQNGTSQYVVWSNGYCIQSGYSSGGAITFLKKFANTDYSISTAIVNTSSTNTIQWFAMSYKDKTPEGMTLHSHSAAQHWTVAGFLAEGEY